MREEPVRQFFSIGDVCTLTELKPHVLRYWETQFRFLSPAKNRSGNRVYQRREVELILLVKHLLYTEKYTIEGARRKVDEHRKAGAIRGVSRVALDRETLESMERELANVPDAMPQDFDTASEVLARAVAHHALGPDSATQLVELFDEARFSPHVMGEEHRDLAVEVLQQVLDELRSLA